MGGFFKYQIRKFVLLYCHVWVMLSLFRTNVMREKQIPTIPKLLESGLGCRKREGNEGRDMRKKGGKGDWGGARV